MSLKRKKSLIRMAKFSFASVIAELVECGVFFLVMLFLGEKLGSAAEFVASLIGRIFANIINFILNRKLVFKSRGGMKKQIIRFTIYSATQLLCSVALIMLVTNLLGIEEAFGSTLVKYAVDLVLFFVGYGVQKSWVFKKSAHVEAVSQPLQPETENTNQ